MARVRYRIWQFFRTVFARPSEADLKIVRQILPPGLFPLFLLMSPSEQAHALRVLSEVQALRPNLPALSEAALLHDVGKSLHPLSAWERTWIVLIKALFPSRMAKWGQGDPVGLRRAFVIAEHHAEWGAEMLSAAGAEPLTIKLVRGHQTASPAGFSTEEAELLALLRQADDNN